MSKKERFESEVIPAYVDRIHDYENSKKEVIQELAERIKAEDLVPEIMICEYIKIIVRRFKAPVTDRLIELALPETFKRKNVLSPNRTISVIAGNRVLVDSSGEMDQQYFLQIKPKVLERDGNKCTVCGTSNHLGVHHKTKVNGLGVDHGVDNLTTLCNRCHSKLHANERPRSQGRFTADNSKGPTEIDLTTKEEMDRDREEMADGLDLNSNETIHELEEQRERDRETIKTMQNHIDDLQTERHRLERLASDAEVGRKATQQDFEKLKERTEELEEALKKSIKKEGFTSASNLPKTNDAPNEIWLPAIDALNLFVPLRKARDAAIDNNQPWRKIIFTLGEDGRVKEAHLADA